MTFASAANGWLGGPPTNDSDNVNLDIDMDNENVAAQEENEDVTMGFIGSLEPTADDFASEMILMAMGSCGKSRLRETRTACRRLGKAMVSEMYSPPRVTAELIRSQKQFRTLLPGFALDLTVNDPEDGQPWDFSKSGKKEQGFEDGSQGRAVHGHRISSLHGLHYVASSQRGTQLEPR